MENLENIYSPELLELFEEYEHYKVFPIIYSIKDTLNKYHEYPEDLCQLCFMTSINYNHYECDHNDSDDEININMIVVNNLAKTEISRTIIMFKMYRCVF